MNSADATTHPARPAAAPVRVQQAAARAALALCVRRCADARDERGRWRAEQACLRALGAGAADVAAAEAARAVGRAVALAAASAGAALATAPGVQAP